MVKDWRSLCFQVYSDLEVAFVISEDETIFNALSKTVELLEGHTALISQYYYGCLIHELLAFQLADRHPPVQVIHFSLLSINYMNAHNSMKLCVRLTIRFWTELTQSGLARIWSPNIWIYNNSAELITLLILWEKSAKFWWSQPSQTHVCDLSSISMNG